MLARLALFALLAFAADAQAACWFKAAPNSDGRTALVSVDGVKMTCTYRQPALMGSIYYCGDSSRGFETLTAGSFWTPATYCAEKYSAPGVLHPDRCRTCFPSF